MALTGEHVHVGIEQILYSGHGSVMLGTDFGQGFLSLHIRGGPARFRPLVGFLQDPGQFAAPNPGRLVKGQIRSLGLP